MKMRDLLNGVNLEEYMVGNATTEKLLNPEEHPFETILDYKVTSITAKGDTPVIWLHMGMGEHEDILNFEE